MVSAISAWSVRRTFCSEVRSSSVCLRRSSVFSSLSSNSYAVVSTMLEDNARLRQTSISSHLFSSKILNWFNRSRYVIGGGATGGATTTNSALEAIFTVRKISTNFAHEQENYQTLEFLGILTFKQRVVLGSRAALARSACMQSAVTPAQRWRRPT